MPLRQLIDVYLALGALPQSMNFAQAQAALAAGTLDGQDAMPTTLVADARVAFPVRNSSRAGVRSRTSWCSRCARRPGMPGPKIAARWCEARRSRRRREANALAREEAALAQLTKDGVTILRLSPAQRNAFRDAAQPVIDAWTSSVGAELADAAQAVVAAARK